MSTVAVSEIIARAQQAADIEDDFISQATWLYWANIEYKKLWTRLARSGYPWNAIDTPIAPTGALQYNTSEPVAILGFRWLNTRGYFRRIEIINPLNMPSQTTLNTGTPEKVSITHDPSNTGNEIVIRPWPVPVAGSGSLIMTSIDKPKNLVLTAPSGNNDNVVRLPNGFEEIIVLNMARRALGKEETTSPALENEAREVKLFIEDSIRSYLLTDQPTVHDVNDPTYDRLPPYTSWWFL